MLAGLGTRSNTEVHDPFQTARRSFAGTVIEDWIRQAKTADKLTRAAASVREIRDAEARAKRAGATASDIEQALVDITSADLWRALASLRRDLLKM